MHTYVRRALQTALVTGGLVAAGASMAHAEEPPHDTLVAVDLPAAATTLPATTVPGTVPGTEPGATVGAAVLADTGWAPWLAFGGGGMIALGLALRRTSTVRRSTRSPFTHPALLDHVPTQRGGPPAA